MMSSGQISDLLGIKWSLYFWKAHNKNFPKIQFLLILDKYFKRYGNINAIWSIFGMGSYQTWSYHVTQAKNLSFSSPKSPKSYSTLYSWKVTKFCGSSAPLKEVMKKTIWRQVESAPPPPHPCGIGLNYNLTSLWRHSDVFYPLNPFADQKINMTSFWRWTSKFLKFRIWIQR